MKFSAKNLILAASFFALLSAGPAPEAPLGVSLIRDAEALIGVPWSPLSVAGVARRTTRRAVIYGSSVAASSAAAASYEAQSAAAPQQAPTAQQQTHRPAGAPPIGTIVGSLPSGCASNAVAIDGVQYYDCKGVYYRAAFQGDNLVYMVTQP